MLSNLFLHYAFDLWMQRTYPYVPFERYADDIVVHTASHAQAVEVLAAIAGRLDTCGLALHPGKTRIVYCKQDGRPGSGEHERFDFLSYTFGARKAKAKDGRLFTGFLPAISNAAAKAKRAQIRAWRLHLWTGKALSDLAAFVNPIVRGWISYYGRFYRSRLITAVLQQINDYLIRWAMRKYKRLCGSRRRAANLLAKIARSEPDLFAHWRIAPPYKAG